MKHFKEFIQWCCEPQRLFVLFIVVLAIPNVALFFTEQQMTLWARICNVILPVSVYWLIMTLGRKPGKTIWILFPFVFFAAFQLVLLYLFGRSIIAVDMFLNLTTTNSGEALELLDNLLPAVIGVFVVYIPALVLGGFSWARGNQLEYSFIRSQRKYALAGIVAGALLTVICYATQRDYQVKIEMYPANVCYNLVLAAERAGETAGYAETSRDFTFNASAAHDENSREVYVLVIGETARACNFGLYGYERNTTPLLDKMEGLVTFTDVLTQSNTTHKSVPMLLSAASAEDYDCLYRQKGIITAFKEADFILPFFRTSFLTILLLIFWGWRQMIGSLSRKMLRKEPIFRMTNYCFW
jgi:Predicted membrane-associated, metal-dependent hydrolase